MKRLEDCQHEFLRFGSNAYYLFCADCPAAWVFKKPTRDIGDPEAHGRCPSIEHNVRIAPRLSEQQGGGT